VPVPSDFPGMNSRSAVSRSRFPQLRRRHPRIANTTGATMLERHVQPTPEITVLVEQAVHADRRLRLTIRPRRIGKHHGEPTLPRLNQSPRRRARAWGRRGIKWRS